jgi:DNA polymerase I-like protein with 3'-5' exonuclease and polymerase domains
MRQNNPALELIWKRHLAAAVALQGRPWGKGADDITGGIEIILDADKAARRIRGLLMLGDFPAAFDYETTSLKPEIKGAEIVCCSICFEGGTTIAYPWAGAAIDATKEFLQSDCPKIGSNIKFEHRWSKHILGVRVRHWEFDVMQCSHILDNREGINSVKFQAFVRYGFPEYDATIRPYLKEHKNGINRIRQVPIKDVCRYCAIDSLVEFKVYEIMARELKGVSNVSSVPAA